MKHVLMHSLRHSPSTRLAYEDSPAIRMEVEEVNPSQKLTTMKPSNTKTSSTKKLTSASSLAKVVPVERESNWGSDWVDDGV